MIAADRASRRLTIVVARCRQPADYTFAATVWAIVPTNKTNSTNNTPPPRSRFRSVPVSGSAPAVFVVFGSNKLALSKSLAAPLRTVLLVGADCSLVLPR
jgi:hypothetical protein